MPYLLLLPGAFFAPIIHEFVKARVSAALGDPTPKKNGFVTWNPLKFFEPIGFFMMMVFQVGWGRPVPTSMLYYKDNRRGIALTYIVPMVANLFIGMLSILLISLFTNALFQWAVNVSSGDSVWAFGFAQNLRNTIFYFGRMNIRLAVFNLIPIYPMAMSKLLHLFVSPETSMRLNQNQKILQILLFLLLIFDTLENFLISPVSNLFIRAVSL
jgi:Zn-dependent protease